MKDKVKIMLIKAWGWLSKNWKYVVTFGIPVLISVIAGLIRKNRSLEKKVELKEIEKDIENKARDIQEGILEEANEDLHERTKDAFDDWTEDLEEIQAKEQELIKEIDTAEKATEAIQEIIDETPWSLPPKSEIKPPKFPHPRKASRNRMCPCGSGFKYRFCCAKNWTPE